MTKDETNRLLLEFAGLRAVSVGIGKVCIYEGDTPRQEGRYDSAAEAFSHFELYGDKRHSAYWRERILLKLVTEGVSFPPISFAPEDKFLLGGKRWGGYNYGATYPEAFCEWACNAIVGRGTETKGLSIEEWENLLSGYVESETTK